MRKHKRVQPFISQLAAMRQFVGRHWKSKFAFAGYGVLLALVGLALHYRHGPQATAPAVRRHYGGAVLDGSWIEKHEKEAEEAAKAVAAAASKAKSAPAASPAAAPTASTTGFGISFGDTLPWLGQADMEAQLRDTAAVGFRWVRIDFDWQNIQPDSSGQFNFSDHDRVMKAAAKYNLKVLGLILFTPSWARPASCAYSPACAPASTAQFASFAQALAAHYGPLGVQHWEIWNEPNIQGAWLPSPDAATYTDLLKRSYTAIKQVSPQAVVISGSTSSIDESTGSINQLTFLNAIYSAGAKGSFDALGYHPYSHPATPDEIHSWSGWSMMNDLPTSLRSIMISNGDGGKQIWATEYGAPTNGPGYQATESGYDPVAGQYYVSEGLQAKMASQAVNKIRASSWAGPLFWYSYKDIGTDASDSENFFGLLRADGSQKAAYTTFKTLLH